MSLDADLTNDGLLSNKIEINLHMLDTLMLNGVGGEVHDTNVVAIDKSASRRRTLELMEQMAQPSGLNHNVGHDAVLGLRTGTRYDGLPLGRPGH
jgi:hypothetical protein